MVMINIRPVGTKCTTAEQIAKIVEEIDEFMYEAEKHPDKGDFTLDPKLVEEAMDVVQSIITLVDNHTIAGFKLYWDRVHMGKMEGRRWVERE